MFLISLTKCLKNSKNTNCNNKKHSKYIFNTALNKSCQIFKQLREEKKSKYEKRMIFNLVNYVFEEFLKTHVMKVAAYSKCIPHAILNRKYQNFKQFKKYIYN